MSDLLKGTIDVWLRLFDRRRFSRSRSKQALCIMLFSFSSLLAIFYTPHLFTSATGGRTDYSNGVVVEREVNSFKNGDLVFRRGRDLVSRMVLEMDDASRYSHVGLIYRAGSQLFVIHAVPAENSAERNEVKMEPFQVFASASRATEIAIYRLREMNDSTHSAVASKAADHALRLAAAHTPFDSEFDLSTPDALYCTELVWHVYKMAGVDLVDGNFDALQIPFRSGEYVLPSTLLKSPHLVRVYDSTRTNRTRKNTITKSTSMTGKNSKHLQGG